MQVAIPVAGSRWPSQCPCCGRPANSTLTLQRSRGLFLVVAATETVLRLRVPYCSTCARHAQAFRGGTLGAMLYPAAMVLFGGFMLGILGLAAGLGREREILMMFGPSVVGTVLFVGYRLVMRARAAVDRRHVSAAPVLRLHTWTEDRVILDCDNASYGAALRQANP